MTLLTYRRRQTQQAALFGTDDFAATLAAREAKLGLNTTATAKTRAPAPVLDDPSPEEEAPTVDDGVRRDPWGNVITSKVGWFGQYAIKHWNGNRTVYVCGDPAEHVQHAYWRLDGRMERGQGYICTRCWTIQAGLYGIDERGR